MLITALQVPARVGDVRGNLARLIPLLSAAAERGAQLAITPELALVGYPPRDLLWRPGLISDVERAIDDLRSFTQQSDLAVLVGAPWRQPDGTLTNSAFLLADGNIAGRADKQLLPYYDVFDEARYFRPGRETLCCTLAGRRIAVTLCEDIWNDPSQAFLDLPYARDPVGGLPGRIDLLVNLSASPFDRTKAAKRRRLLTSVAGRVQAPLVYVNQVGAQDELVFDGQSSVTSPGEHPIEAPRFAACALDVHLGMEGAAVVRSEHLVNAAGAPPRCAALAANPSAEPSEALVLRAALLTGLHGYVRNNGFERVLVGLSGGLDSALVALLAAEALGADAVSALSLPSRHSSDHSREDAQALADAAGFSCREMSIEDVVQAAERSLRTTLGESLAGLTLENLQARARGTLLMAVSNQHHALLLTTGNKSELAVGYCTLYGDMCGALAPIADVFKTQAYAIAHTYDDGPTPMPGRILTKAPSAELRPDQRDDDSLPPYPVLDRILMGFIEERLDAAALIAAGEDAGIVREVLSLVRGAEFKRWQAAPLIKVSARAFGGGWRMPLTATWPGLR